MSDDDLPLPDLQDAILDEATLARLLGDIEALGAEIEARVKAAPDRMTPPGAVSLQAGAAALASGALGVQIRYLYNGQRWCDTLLRTGSGVRLVRMQIPG